MATLSHTDSVWGRLAKLSNIGSRAGHNRLCEMLEIGARCTKPRNGQDTSDNCLSVIVATVSSTRLGHNCVGEQ